jgi:class 3 adenylate cyclase
MTGGFQVPTRTAPVAFLSALVSAFRWVIFIAILLLLAPLALSYVKDPQRYPVTNYVYQGHDYLMRTLGTPVRQYIPTNIAGKDRTDWILIAGLLICSFAAGSFRQRVAMQSARRQLRRQVADWKKAMHVQDNSAVGRELEAKLQSLESGEGSREELLRVFAETKKKLDSMGREVAFLSIDVVGSTAMKVNEDPAAAQYDFLEYRRLVESVFKARGVLKSTWTPDGVMACFSNADDAVQAGKDVIRGLDHFNREVKLMKTDFAVRCGVNAGFVHFDDRTPLEAMSDRVIDIAGHMQKYAEPNTVAVARKIIEPLRERGGFEPTRKVVDGYEVSHWVYDRPENRLSTRH